MVMTVPVERRTSAEVALAEQAKAENLQKAQYAIDVAVAAYAQMQMDQDAAAAEEERNAVLTIADAGIDEDSPRTHRMLADPVAHFLDPEQFLMIDEEDFARIENDEAYQSDDAFAPVVSKKTAKAKPRPKKLTKGELMQSIEEKMVQAKLAASAASKIVRKKAIQNSNAASSSTLAGVSPGFSAKHFKDLRDLYPTKDASPASSPSMGGLRDADTVATRPFVKKKTAYALQFMQGVDRLTAPAKVARKNTFVAIDDDSDDDVQIVPRPKAQRVSKPKTIKNEPVTKMTALTFNTKTGVPAAVKSKKSKVAAAPDTAFVPLAHTISANGLPTFVADRWATAVMPALHRALNDSKTPMNLGQQNDNTIKVIQRLIDDACPGNTYTARWSDSVVSRAGQRLYERRNSMSHNAKECIAAFLAGNLKAFPNRLKIQEYARYAINRRGPAFFKEPTPLKRIQILDKEDSRYVKPRGLFESDFVIAVAAPLLKVGGSQHPIGALALAAAAVERAWYDVLNEGTSTFGNEKAGNAVTGYVASAQKLSEAAWQRILNACNEHTVQTASEATSDAPELSLDGLRENMYEPSSPAGPD
ncbi:hypothetical protein DFH06DRAFT_1135921 [Mycena polygramma]|nr:hypothetical protein DFH06DRAFT_1135921 [Mycena polygramma]